MCNCPDHDKVGSDELWLTPGELADLISDGIDAMMALPGDATRAERRSAMLYRLEQSRAGQSEQPPPTRRERAAGRIFGN